MQTLEQYTEPVGRPAPKRPSGAVLAVAALVLLAASVIAIPTRIGVLVALGITFVAAIGLLIVRRELALFQVVAFSIHFDGVGLGEVSLGRILSAIVLANVAYKLLTEKWRPPALPTRYWIGPLALMTWAMLSGLWSQRAGAFLIGIGTIGLAIGFYVAAGMLVDSFDKISSFMRAYWYGGIFGSISGLIGLVMQTRAYGFNADANLFGVLAASMIPLTIYYRRHATTAQAKFIYSIVLLMVLGGAAGAGSRSGVIGAAVALFGTLIYRPGESVGRRIGAIIPAGVVTLLIAVLLVVANPNTLERGTNSSGRTDFWRVTFDLIAERPLVGHGQRQINEMIPDLLATTPGTGNQVERREEVSSHNTWLDFLGNLGVIGFSLYLFIIIVTAIGFLRPHWTQTKEVSGYLFLMMLPVLTGSMFLDMSNNKLAWSLIGLAGILQVPSWGRRYRGYFSPPPKEQAPDRFAATKLARWDLKISQRFRIWVLAGAVIGGLTFAGAAASSSPIYTASVAVIVPRLDISANLPLVPLDRERVSMIHTLVLSDAYAGELIERSGVDASPEEIRDSVSVERHTFGVYLTIMFSSRDERLVDDIAPHLLESIDALIDEGREFATPTVRDELRPMNPGEQRYYTGPMYLTASEYVDRSLAPPRTLWNLIIGTLTGTFVASGYMLLQQRKPRVNDEDNLEDAVGLPLWSHVGRTGRRRNAATADQYAHIAHRSTEGFDPDAMPKRIVVAGPVRSRSTRALALGCASAFAALGNRVVLVDGQVSGSRLSRHLGFMRAPGVRELADGTASLDRVLRRLKPLFLPRVIRRLLRSDRESIRFISAGRIGSRGQGAFDPSLLDELDDTIMTVVLSPPLTGTVPVGPVLSWADVVMYDLVEGETVTFDAEDGALQIATFARGSAGVILSEV